MNIKTLNQQLSSNLTYYTVFNYQRIKRVVGLREEIKAQNYAANIIDRPTIIFQESKS